MSTPDPEASEPQSLFDRIAEAIDHKVDATAGKLNALTDTLQQRFRRQGESEPDAADSLAAQESADESSTNQQAGAGRLRIAAYVGAVAVAAAASGAGVFYVLSDRIARQEAELSRQSAELEASNQALKDSEKRYLDQQLELVKTETRLARTEEQLKAQAEAAPVPATPAAVQPSSRLTELPRITVTRAVARGKPQDLPGGKCVVSEDNLAETLRGCLQILNREL